MLGLKNSINFVFRDPAVNPQGVSRTRLLTQARLTAAGTVPACLAPPRRNLFHPFKCLVEALKPSFLLSKRLAVINRPARHYSGRVLNVKHLMIKYIFHYKLRNGRVVQAAAYYDRRVNVI